MRLVALVFSGLTKGAKGSNLKEDEGYVVKVSYSFLLVGRVILGFCLSEVCGRFAFFFEGIKEEKVFVLGLGAASLGVFVVNSVELKRVINLNLGRFLGSM